MKKKKNSLSISAESNTNVHERSSSVAVVNEDSKGEDAGPIRRSQRSKSSTDFYHNSHIRPEDTGLKTENEVALKSQRGNRVIASNRKSLRSNKSNANDSIVAEAACNDSSTDHQVISNVISDNGKDTVQSLSHSSGKISPSNKRKSETPKRNKIIDCKVKVKSNDDTQHEQNVPESKTESCSIDESHSAVVVDESIDSNSSLQDSIEQQQSTKATLDLEIDEKKPSECNEDTTPNTCEVQHMHHIDENNSKYLDKQGENRESECEISANDNISQETLKGTNVNSENQESQSVLHETTPKCLESILGPEQVVPASKVSSSENDEVTEVLQTIPTIEHNAEIQLEFLPIIAGDTSHMHGINDGVALHDCHQNSSLKRESDDKSDSLQLHFLDADQDEEDVFLDADQEEQDVGSNKLLEPGDVLISSPENLSSMNDIVDGTRSEKNIVSRMNILIAQETLEQCKNIDTSENEARQKQLLLATQQYGAHISGLKKSLPDLSEHEIQNMIDRIRKEREINDTSWSDDEIKRLQGAGKAFGGIKNLARIVSAVGTRTEKQIISQWEKMIEVKTTSNGANAESTHGAALMSDAGKTNNSVHHFDKNVAEFNTKPPEETGKAMFAESELQRLQDASPDTTVVDDGSRRNKGEVKHGNIISNDMSLVSSLNGDMAPITQQTADIQPDSAEISDRGKSLAEVDVATVSSLDDFENPSETGNALPAERELQTLLDVSTDTPVVDDGSRLNKEEVKHGNILSNKIAVVSGLNRKMAPRKQKTADIQYDSEEITVRGQTESADTGNDIQAPASLSKNGKAKSKNKFLNETLEKNHVVKRTAKHLHEAVNTFQISSLVNQLLDTTNIDDIAVVSNSNRKAALRKRKTMDIQHDNEEITVCGSKNDQTQIGSSRQDTQIRASLSNNGKKRSKSQMLNGTLEKRHVVERSARHPEEAKNTLQNSSLVKQFSDSGNIDGSLSRASAKRSMKKLKAESTEPSIDAEHTLDQLEAGINEMDISSSDKHISNSEKQISINGIVSVIEPDPNAICNFEMQPDESCLKSETNKKKVGLHWQKDEIDRLKAGIAVHGIDDIKALSEAVHSRSVIAVRVYLSRLGKKNKKSQLFDKMPEVNLIGGSAEKQSADPMEILKNAWQNESLAESVLDDDTGLNHAHSNENEDVIERKTDKRRKWKNNEIVRLKRAVRVHDIHDYKALATAIGSRNEKQVQSYLLTQSKKYPALQNVDSSVDLMLENKPATEHESVKELTKVSSSSLDQSRDSTLIEEQSEAAMKLSAAASSLAAVSHLVTESWDGSKVSPEESAKKEDDSPTPCLEMRAGRWHNDEILRLRKAIYHHGKDNLDALEAAVGSRSIDQITNLFRNVDKGKSHYKLFDYKEDEDSPSPSLKKRAGRWYDDEISRLQKAIYHHGKDNLDALEIAVGSRSKAQIANLYRNVDHGKSNYKLFDCEEDVQKQSSASKVLDVNKKIPKGKTQVGKSSKDGMKRVDDGMGIPGRTNFDASESVLGNTSPKRGRPRINRQLDEETVLKPKKRKLAETEGNVMDNRENQRTTPKRSTARAASAKIAMGCIFEMDNFEDPLSDDNAKTNSDLDVTVDSKPVMWDKIDPTCSDKRKGRKPFKKRKKKDGAPINTAEGSDVTEPCDNLIRERNPCSNEVTKKDKMKKRDPNAMKSDNQQHRLHSRGSKKPNVTNAFKNVGEDFLLNLDTCVDIGTTIDLENDVPTDSVMITVAKSDMPFFVEEMAFHHYSKLSKSEELEPLPEAFPLPEFPSERWSFDENSRVVHADFKNCEEIPTTEKRFAAQMMQRDDITLIFDGLLSNLDAKKWTMSSIEQTFCEKPYHKFRRFNKKLDADGMISFVEQDKFTSMKVSDFLRYLSIMQRQDDSTSDHSFQYVDADGKDHTIEDVPKVIFYMIDVDMPKLLPAHDKDYKKSFKLPEILPGGSWCMMGSLPESARPFMGPNFYLTPGGGYTQFHQDGHGTVDSGHSNLSGFNEVIMLRRLPECHKIYACQKIPVLSGNRTVEDAFKTLYRLPHDDGREESCCWPTHNTIEEWKQMNYYPSVFILKPGQHVHINKGRLHAFRKFTCSALPESDCHSRLRCEIIEEFNLKKSPICLSVAFDWMFWGADKEGINREVAATVECAALCRDYSCKSLAIPETVILCSAMLACGRHDARMEDTSMLSFETSKFEIPSCCPSESDLIAGILPSLRYIQKRDRSAAESANSENRDNLHKGVKLKKAKKPDTFHDPAVYPVDPYGSDYFCMVCNQELSNSYFHCNGCEVLLNKDFNICSRCYSEEKFLARIQVHPTSNKWYSDVNHIGNTERTADSRGCPCHAGRCRACPEAYCKCCSCQCHKVFTNQFRFIDQEAADKLIRNCEKIVNGAEVKFSQETEARLHRSFLMNVRK